MDLSKAQLNEYRLHAVTLLSAAAGMSQVDSVATYAPVASALAFLAAASSYGQVLKRAEDLVDAPEDAGIIDEEIADAVEEIIDKVDGVKKKNNYSLIILIKIIQVNGFIQPCISFILV